MFRVDTTHQRVMQEAFWRQLREQCRPAATTDRPFPMVVGIETEYLLVGSGGRLIPEAVRNRILEHLPHSSSELGVSTLETHTDPVPLIDSRHGMLQEMRKIEHETIAAARDEDSRLVRIGAYPGSFHELAVTQQPYRYQYLMDISHYLHDIRYGRHDQATPISVGDITLPIKRCDVMSGCQSVHINIQMPAGELAVRLLNKAIEMTPYLVALGAHSPLMNCQHSGYMEYRMPLWEPLFTFPNIDTKYGVNTRRTGLPDYYYRSWDDYWRDVGRKLYLTHETERALETNMKVFWRTVRLKPCPGREHDCLLELRALSTQPTLEEDAAFYLLFSGLIHEPAWYERPLLPLEYVKVNFDLVSIYGLDTELYVQEGSTIARRPARAILKALLDEALALWRSHSPESADLVALLYKRLRPETGSPAHQSVRLFDEAMQQGHTPAAAAQQVLLAYVIGSEQQVKSL